MNPSKCQVCLLENVPNNVCNHDENTVFLMSCWLKYRPKSLLEFYICIHHEVSLIDPNKCINHSVKKFVDYYNLFE